MGGRGGSTWKGPDPRTEALRSGPGICGTHQELKRLKLMVQRGRGLVSRGLAGVSSRGCLYSSAPVSDICGAPSVRQGHLPLGGSSQVGKTDRVPRPEELMYVVDVKSERS